MKNNYELWKEKIEHLKNELLKRDNLLRQYALWLETSEENTLHKGGDVYNMIEGVMHGLIEEGIDFIPGIGWQNFVAVVSAVQKETGLDLGVCRFLENNLDEMKRFEYLGEQSGKTLSECKAATKMSMGSLSCCIPPQRCGCPYRKAMLTELEKKISGEL